MEGMRVLNQEEVMKCSNSYKWIVLLLATAVQASATLITYGVGPLAFFWKEIYHLTDMQMGMLLTAVNIGPLFCMLFVGRLLDQYNERLLIGVLFLVFYREPLASREYALNNKGISIWKQLKEVMSNKELYPVLFTGICMISLQMVLIGHFINFLITAKSITPVLAGKVFAVTLFWGMMGRIVLATASDSFYKGNRCGQYDPHLNVQQKKKS